MGISRSSLAYNGKSKEYQGSITLKKLIPESLKEEDWVLWISEKDRNQALVTAAGKMDSLVIHKHYYRREITSQEQEDYPIFLATYHF